MYQQILDLIAPAQTIVIIQADNPDADSLASALALEHLLGDMGKIPHLYCGIDMPEYLKYLPGWDRVNKELPGNFDMSIIVDTSAISLLQKIEETGSRGWIASKPVLVLDHHAGTADDIPYATLVVNESSRVSTGELIYAIAEELEWPMSLAAKECIMTSILADSMGLTTENTTASTYRVMAELVESGVNRPKLEEQRRLFNKMPESIFRYKAALIERTSMHHDGKLALVVVPQDEINEYSPLYNPAPLIQGDHLQTADVLVSIVLKSYDSGRITAAIRCNQGAPIAAKLAKSFDGGGHAYAAGFKIEQADLETTKNACIKKVAELLERHSS